MIIMEFAEHGNLLHYLKERSPTDEYYLTQDPGGKHLKRNHKHKKVQKNIMEDKQLMSIIWQVAKGMEHLACMKVSVYIVHVYKNQSQTIYGWITVI